MMPKRLLLLLCVAALVGSALPGAATEGRPGQNPDPSEGGGGQAEEAGGTNDRETASLAATAEPADTAGAEELADYLRDSETEAGTYIVQFESPAVPSYTGGVEGLEATAADGQLDLNAAAVQAYRNHLADEQDVGLEAIRQELDRDVAPLNTYDLAINGATFELEPGEAAQLALLPEIKFVEREQIFELHTDAGPEHMGAETIWEGAFGGADPDTEYKGEEVVVGIIDSGISPENPSFAEVGPEDGYVHEWDGEYLGVCNPESDDYDDEFPCNGKLIGAYSFRFNPRDDNGHGTHVASTAAGNEVDAYLDAQPDEPVRISGVAPHAHIISYEVCSAIGCPGEAILSAIEQATEDGVDVVNSSLGSTAPSTDLWTAANNVAWLNLNAAGARIAHSAGNEGPGDATVGSSSDLPWVSAVGASEHHRAVSNGFSNIEGDEGQTLDGIVGKGFTDPLDEPASVVYDTDNPHCYAGVWDADEFGGEIVLCDRGGPDPIDRVQSAVNVEAAGGGGFALVNDQENAESLNADEFVIPGAHISWEDGETFKQFVAENETVTATVNGYAFTYDSPWTGMQASFSSRGRNRATHSLAPTFTAPGVDVIAAMGNYLDSDEYPDDEYGVLSGTSMSSPHVAGAYALLTQARPEWSHAQTQSAMQLTARPDTFKEDNETPGDPHSEGSGYVDLTVAADAGFVMDITAEDYENANPDEGGDVRQLNAAAFVNNDAYGAFTWHRTFESAVDEHVTWSVEYSSDDGIDLDGPSELTIAGGGEADFELTVTVDEDLPFRESFYGQVTLTPDLGDLPPVQMPVAVSATHPQTELTADPGQISQLQEADEVTEHTLSLGNDGGAHVAWEFVEGTLEGPVRNQAQEGTQGIASHFFIDEFLTDAGVYAADDFTVHGEEAVELDSLFIPGFWSPGYDRSLADAETLHWFIYPDAGGEPAGHPEADEDQSVWQFTTEPAASGVHIAENKVSLDIPESGAEPLSLERGTYWLVFYPSAHGGITDVGDRWNWHQGTPAGTAAQHIDPQRTLPDGRADWTGLDDIGLDWEGLAFLLTGEVHCDTPGWLSTDPASGELAPGGEEEITVTLDANGMDNGTYEASLCLATDELVAPVTTVDITMEVTALGAVEGTVTGEDTGSPVENAAVSIDGHDLSATTDADGAYVIDNVPFGEQTVVAQATGYGPAEQEVVVEDGETTSDANLVLPTLVGVAGDHNGSLRAFLENHGVSTAEFAWGDDVSEFDAIIINRGGQTGEDVFLDFIDETDDVGTGVMLLDTWQTAGGGNGILLANLYLENPGVRDSGTTFSSDADLTYEVTIPHPIVGDASEGTSIPFNTSASTKYYAWFDEYTDDGAGEDVTVIADVALGGDVEGRGLAVDDRENNHHVLLSMHGTSQNSQPDSPDYWEPESEELFLSATEYAKNGQVGEPAAHLDPQAFEVTLAEGASTVETLAIESTGNNALAWQVGTAQESCPGPGGVPWLAAGPTWGLTEPNEADEIEVTFDAADLDAGEYDALLCVTSNAPDNSPAEVPVTLTVEPAPEPELVSVEVTPESADLAVGQTEEFTATAVFDDGSEENVTSDADWVSDDEDIATVDAGVVTGVAEGAAVVSASFEGETDSAAVTVFDDPEPPPGELVDVDVSPSESTIGVDGVVQLEATAVYEDESTREVTEDADWASQDTDVATVDGGLVVGVAEGATEVTATFEGESDSASVTVDAEVEPGPVGLERISAEPGRVEVAIAASQHRFGDGEADAVVLARADAYPDALAGTTLAAEHDAPLLLTSSDQLLDNVAEEIARALSDDGQVYLAGGTAALDENVEDAVDGLGYDLTRLGGQTRFETAGLIADELGERSQVLVTTGLDFPDALTAGAAAAANDGVVLLSADEDPHEVVDDYLDGFDGPVTAVGGPATRAYPDAEAVMGATRDETAVAVAEVFFDEPTAFGVARRDDYPDALAGGAHIAAYEGPLLLSYTDQVPEETAEWLQATDATGGFVYGGTAAIDEDTFDELEDLTFDDDDDNDNGNDNGE